MRGACVAILAALLASALAASGAAQSVPGEDHVAAVRALVAAVEAGEQDAFEARFGRRVRGMQPDELWEGARNLVGRFGAIEDVSLGSLDEESGGVYVKVTFATADREVFVRLDDDGLIRQLLYVPPTAQ